MGEVKLGRAKTIADGITSAEDKEYGVLNNSKYIPTNGNTVGYTFKGIDGLVLGANYLLAQERHKYTAGGVGVPRTVAGEVYPQKSAMAFRLVQNMMQTTLLQVLLMVVQIIKKILQ